MRLLIALRSEAIANLLSAALSENEIHICATGPETISVLDTLQPDALILDLRLYGMDGITVLQNARHKPPVILALTDIVTDSILESAADAGVQDVILIPCTIGYIIEHLKALIEKAPSPDP